MAARARKFGPALFEDSAPFSDMNITPLIDVLLVLLVMMILTIPIMTHKVPIDLPGATPADYEPGPVHRIELTAGNALTWDGVALSDAALPGKLAGLMNEDRAELQIRADGKARYEHFDQVLAVIKRAGVTRLGFIGNERFAHFDTLPK